MKFFISLGSVLTLLCILTEAQGSEVITDFAKKMWALDVNRIEESLDTYTLDLQDKTTVESPENKATRSLFTLDAFNRNEIYNQGTYKTFTPLCDNYDPRVGYEEDDTPLEQYEVSSYLDDIMNTNLMTEAFRQFKANGSVTDLEDFKQKARTAFFALHEHVHHEEEHSIQAVHVDDSCGFELIFCGEVEDIDNNVHGLHNWITFYEQEYDNNLDYYGHLDSESVNGKYQLLEVQYSWVLGKIMPSASMLVGVSTEFEIAIYMACFFRKPSDKETVHCTFNIDGLVNIGVHVHTTESGSHISEAHMEHIHI